MHHLREDEQKHGVTTRFKRPRACVVVPGRELAVQVLVSVITDSGLNQRSLRDSTISHGVCVGEMLVLKAICDALTH